MKKIILLSAFVGLSTAVSVKAADAREIWTTQCAKCHGVEGKGDTKIGLKLGVKDLTDAKVQADIKDDAATKAIKDGIKDADGKTKMKAFVTGAETPLADDEVQALVAYVRALKK